MTLAVVSRTVLAVSLQQSGVLYSVNSIKHTVWLDRQGLHTEYSIGHYHLVKYSGNCALREMFKKNPATGGDTLSPHFWFQVFYYFHSSNLLLHNWNLLCREDLFTYKGYLYFGCLFYSWGLDFLNGQNIYF